MPAPTNLEQLLLEYVNAARLDPLGDAARYISSYAPLTSPDANIQGAINFFGVNGATFLSQMQALTPVQPLAWNDSIGTAARNHSQAMIDQDSQSHQLPGEATLGARVTAAGYRSSWVTVASAPLTRAGAASGSAQGGSGRCSSSAEPGTQPPVR